MARLVLTFISLGVRPRHSSQRPSQFLPAEPEEHSAATNRGAWGRQTSWEKEPENGPRQPASQSKCHSTPDVIQFIMNYNWDKIITLWGSLGDSAALLQIQVSIFPSKQWDESLTHFLLPGVSLGSPGETAKPEEGGPGVWDSQSCWSVRRPADKACDLSGFVKMPKGLGRGRLEKGEVKITPKGRTTDLHLPQAHRAPCSIAPEPVSRGKCA